MDHAHLVFMKQTPHNLKKIKEICGILAYTGYMNSHDNSKNNVVLIDYEDFSKLHSLAIDLMHNLGLKNET